ncbi:hypothetical protein BJF78_16295 [Pseudonocardia sp. CNS-139]|nr:hypothetical protein BJF78_16295 [Pseudonocardia sp. CNS-139]
MARDRHQPHDRRDRALSLIGVDTPYWQVALLMLVVGWGLGANMQPLTLAVQNAMPPRDMGVATASATFFRQMGGTLGTAVFLSLLFGTVATYVAEGFRAAAGTAPFQAALADPRTAANPSNAPILGALQGGGTVSLDDSSFLAGADPVLARPILDGFADAMGVVFLSAAAVLVLGLVAVLMMREVPLRTQSGVEAQRAEDQRAGEDAAERAARNGPGPDPIETLHPSATPVTIPREARPGGEPDAGARPG